MKFLVYKSFFLRIFFYKIFKVLKRGKGNEFVCNDSALINTKLLFSTNKTLVDSPHRIMNIKFIKCKPIEFYEFPRQLNSKTTKKSIK